MDYTYYPGCSLHTSGRSYDKSMRALFSALGSQLVELDDWNCCGATAYTSVKETVAYAISARNLALAEKAGLDIVAPCSACYCVLQKTKSLLAKNEQLKEQVATALAEASLDCEFTMPVRHPLETILTDFGPAELAKRQKRSLAGWKPACYYGCQLIRPTSAIAADPEAPMVMEQLFNTLGAEAVDYPPKVRCCGGMLIATNVKTAKKLCDELISRAVENGANCIVTTCPLCQANLDMIQDNLSANAIPVLYFTQVLALAMGCDVNSLGLEHHLIDPATKLQALLEKAA